LVEVVNTLASKVTEEKIDKTLAVLKQTNPEEYSQLYSASTEIISVFEDEVSSVINACSEEFAVTRKESDDLKNSMIAELKDLMPEFLQSLSKDGSDWKRKMINFFYETCRDALDSYVEKTRTKSRISIIVFPHDSVSVRPIVNRFASFFSQRSFVTRRLTVYKPKTNHECDVSIHKSTPTPHALGRRGYPRQSNNGNSRLIVHLIVGDTDEVARNEQMYRDDIIVLWFPTRLYIQLLESTGEKHMSYIREMCERIIDEHC